MSSRILVVDDDPDTRLLLSANLASRGYETQTAESAEAAIERLELEGFDALVTDVQMGGMSGIDLCARLRDDWPDVPVIVMTGRSSTQVAVAALRAGARDFVSKPIDIEEVAHRLSNGLHRVALEREVGELRRRLHRAPETTMIGESGALARTQSLVSRVADADVPVLVTGESGVGKEVVARELHRQSERAGEPFIAVNCAAIPSQLLESELFGHVRGAFTGAAKARDGLFIEAGRGTIFLDEIGELPIELQPKLLRALQERVVRSVGSDQTTAFHGRIVTATNRDLEDEIEAGRFREDLYYRVNVVNIHIPPLRARGRDILLLAQHFLQAIAERNARPVHGLRAAAAAKLLTYDWPGNVRELENCIEHAVALAQYEELTVADLPERVSKYERGTLVVETPMPEELVTLDELEARYIRKVMRAVDGNKTRAAQVLGLARRTLYRRLDRLEPASDEDEGRA